MGRDGVAHTRTHVYSHTCMHMTHGDRARAGVLGTNRKPAPAPPPPPSPHPPVPSLVPPPHLLGLGRGLGREAGAGTFRDPAVSVMRAHQLGR